MCVPSSVSASRTHRVLLLMRYDPMQERIDIWLYFFLSIDLPLHSELRHALYQFRYLEL